MLLRPITNCSSFCAGVRRVTQLHVRPRPRPYKRRLFEATLAPSLPKELTEEWKKLNDPMNVYSVSKPYNQIEKEFTLYELAHVEKLRDWIRREGFRVMAICQLNHIKEDAFWLGKNQLRMNGLELCDAPSKIVRKMFESTPFRGLNPLIVDDCTGFLFGKNSDAIEAVFSQCACYSWIMPIALTFDDRILPIDQGKELAAKDSLDRLRLQIVQLLTHITGQIPDSLDKIVGQLPATLESHLSSHGHSV